MLRCWKPAAFRTGFSNVNCFWCGEEHEGRLIWPYHALSVVWCPGFMVVTTSSTYLSTAVSNQGLRNCSKVYRGCWICESHVGQFCCGNSAFRIQGSPVLQKFCDFSKLAFWIYGHPSHFAKVDFRPLFFIPHVIFRWFMYADVTVETLAVIHRIIFVICQFHICTS